MNRHLRLEHKRVVDLCPQAPFNFDATLHKPDHFPSSDNAWEPGVRWQAMLWQGERLGLKFENRGTVQRPAISLSVWSQDQLPASFLDGLVAEIDYRLNLQLDLREFNRRFKDDAQLGPIIRQWRGLRPMCYSSLYEYLMIAIVLQNCTVRRSANMLQTLFEHYGTPLSFDGRDFYSCWTPEDIDPATEQELRALKVGYRAKSIKRVTGAFVNKQVDELALRNRLVEEQREALLGLYGIGPASVGYILFDVFHQMDDFNHISPWEQKIYTKLFFDRDPEKPVPVDKLLRLFHTRFAGYRMLAVHYIWEDLFWKRQHEHLPWLEALIRL